MAAAASDALRWWSKFLRGSVTAALVTAAAHWSIDRCHTSGPARSYAAAVLRGSGPARPSSGLQRLSQRLQRHISRARMASECHHRDSRMRKCAVPKPRERVRAAMVVV
ncbi:hypothetical protein FB45DRAFT_871350 [Roridomyces roridus]|uniref:Uncharacterized protein n=1 Tax=Roridomyces roridus TaxID=1738132 RepID=A0AAD7BGU8_9AGAR|nr:hypothetical protein FB45DRAFT_871350 [Roridomyces roridus]